MYKPLWASYEIKLGWLGSICRDGRSLLCMWSHLCKQLRQSLFPTWINANVELHDGTGVKDSRLCLVMKRLGHVRTTSKHFSGIHVRYKTRLCLVFTEAISWRPEAEALNHVALSKGWRRCWWVGQSSAVDPSSDDFIGRATPTSSFQFWLKKWMIKGKMLIYRFGESAWSKCVLRRGIIMSIQEKVQRSFNVNRIWILEICQHSITGILVLYKKDQSSSTQRFCFHNKKFMGFSRSFFGSFYTTACKNFQTRQDKPRDRCVPEPQGFSFLLELYSTQTSAAVFIWIFHIRMLVL